jgi:hypothetical protein
LIGFSPDRNPAALAQSSTVPILCRTRLAVTCFVSQIGPNTFKISGVSISVYTAVTNNRDRILLKRVDPLLSVPGVLPGGAVLLVDPLSGFRECWHHGSRLTSQGEGIFTLSRKFAVSEGLFARFSQRDERKPAKANVPAATLNHCAEHPPLGTRGLNYEIKTVTISVATRLLERANTRL